VEKLFVGMALVFLAYPVAAMLARPDWGEVARGALVPTVRAEPAYLSMLVAMIGTTITPYMQLFQQSALVDKQVGRRHYGPERADAYIGSVFTNAIAAFIIIATAATLHAAGSTDIETAADAATALEPAAGPAASGLFAVGLLGASLLAAGVLPLATAYAVAETFGFRRGVNLDFRRAPFFQGCFTALTILGAALALIPGVPVIDLLVGVQILNGVLLPVVLVFLLLLANDPLLAGNLKNGRVNNILGWGTVAVVTAAVAAMLGMELAQAVGLVGGG
jgi:Mn2+/Fe2+ NRAMP family transporter